ncbi:MAG: DUF1043 family protein [Pseudomonadota bacterium]
MVSTLGIVVIALICLAIGLGLGYWFAQMDKGIETSKVRRAEAQLDEYRNNMTAHFEVSAQHFQSIGRQYRELYDHMATSAESLLGEVAQNDANPFPRIEQTAATAVAVEDAVGEIDGNEAIEDGDEVDPDQTQVLSTADLPFEQEADVEAEVTDDSIEDMVDTDATQVLPAADIRAALSGETEPVDDEASEDSDLDATMEMPLPDDWDPSDPDRGRAA